MSFIERILGPSKEKQIFDLLKELEVQPQDLSGAGPNEHWRTCLRVSFRHDDPEVAKARAERFLEQMQKIDKHAEGSFDIHSEKFQEIMVEPCPVSIYLTTARSLEDIFNKYGNAGRAR